MAMTAPPSLRTYILIGQKFVQGWVESEVFAMAEALSEVQSRHGVRGGVAEIGVHHGRFFIGLHLMRDPGTKSVAMDLFSHQSLNVDQSGKGDEYAFRRNLDRWAGGDRDVEIREVDSTTIDGQYVRDLAGGPIRLFSVDGGHTPEIVKHDMQTAEGCLAPGGIVIGDDVFNCEWPGVAEGTLQYLDSSTGLVPFGIGFNKVLFTTPDYAERYRDVIGELAKRKLWHCKLSYMRGHQVAIAWQSTLLGKGRKVYLNLTSG